MVSIKVDFLKNSTGTVMIIGFDPLLFCGLYFLQNSVGSVIRILEERTLVLAGCCLHIRRVLEMK
jgi:hypothetical protein